MKSESLEALKKCTTSHGWFYFSRLRSVLLPCQSWGPTGPRCSGWIWNESGHFIVFSGEKLWDLVLLEKNSKPSGELDLDAGKFWLWAAFRFGKSFSPGLCFVIWSCVVLGLFTMQHVSCTDITIKVVGCEKHKDESCHVFFYWNGSPNRQIMNLNGFMRQKCTNPLFDRLPDVTIYSKHLLVILIVYYDYIIKLNCRIFLLQHPKGKNVNVFEV